MLELLRAMCLKRFIFQVEFYLKILKNICSWVRFNFETLGNTLKEFDSKPSKVVFQRLEKAVKDIQFQLFLPIATESHQPVVLVADSIQIVTENEFRYGTSKAKLSLIKKGNLKISWPLFFINYILKIADKSKKKFSVKRKKILRSVRNLWKKLENMKKF